MAVKIAASVGSSLTNSRLCGQSHAAVEVNIRAGTKASGKITYPVAMILRSREERARPVGNVSPRCRNTLPHNPPATWEIVYARSPLAASRQYTNHAKPSSTMSAPVRLCGRRRHA